jgi:hypothetical protein
MKKIAILIGGLIRDYENAYPYLKENLLDKYDCDIFISTWDIKESHGTNRRNYNRIIDWSSTKKITQFEKDKLLELYNPKKIQIENFYVWEKNNKDNILNFMEKNSFTLYRKILNNIFCQWYKIFDVFKLYNTYKYDNNKIYDIVIKMRFDVIFEHIDINIITDNKLYFLNNWGKKNNKIDLIPSKLDVVEDYIFFGKEGNMKKILNIYNHITDNKNLFNDKKYLLQSQVNNVPVSEFIITYYLIDNNIPYDILYIFTKLTDNKISGLFDSSGTPI